MSERQTVGVPTIRVPVSLTDPALRAAFQAFSLEVNQWLQTVAEAVDKVSGLRGTATIHSVLDLRGNRLTNLAAPVGDMDAVPAGLALRRPGPTAAFDAEGFPIHNIQEANVATDAVNLSQLTATVTNTVAGLAAVNAPPEVETASALGTVRTRFAREDHTHSGANLGDAQALSNKELITPTIADFTNAQHDHQDPNDGGQLTVAALSSYVDDTFTITGTGFTASVTGTARYVVLGSLVLLFLPALSGTSNATTFTLTGIPAGIQSARLAALTLVTVTDNGTVQATPGQIQIQAGGTAWDVFKDAAQTAFTNSGTKALGATFLAYHRS
jgi:hypothetical protein